MTTIDYSGCRSAEQQEILRETVHRSFGDIYTQVWGNLVSREPYIIAFHPVSGYHTFGIDVYKRQATN